MTESTIQSLLKNAKNIAIYGLSPNTQKDSFKVAAYLQEHNFTITPIYPKEDVILGEKVYRNLADALIAKKYFDIVVAFRNAKACEAVAREILALPRGSIGAFWMQLGIRNQNVVELLESYGILSIQDKCIKIEHTKL